MNPLTLLRKLWRTPANQQDRFYRVEEGRRYDLRLSTGKRLRATAMETAEEDEQFFEAVTFSAHGGGEVLTIDKRKSELLEVL